MIWAPIPEFRPHPLAPGGHLQTILGTLLPSPDWLVGTRRIALRMPDGDHIVIHEDVPVGWRPGKPIGLLVHGLGGTHASGYVVRLANRLFQRGWRVFRTDARGFGAGTALARGHTHAGRTDDLLAALRWVAGLSAASPVLAIAYSLGGNQLLKLLGERADDLPANLGAAIAVAPPLRLEECARAMRLGLSRFYDLNMVAALKRQVQRRRHVEGFQAAEGIPIPGRLYAFDRSWTAPLSGFESVAHYYRDSGAAPFLESIRTPTLILVADDDPVVPIGTYRELTLPDRITLHRTRGGGHLGYLGRASADPDRRWLDWRLVDQAAAFEHRRRNP